MSYLPNYICSRSFRKLVAHHYPDAENDPALWGLLGYNFFGTFKDKPSRNKIISRVVLTSIESYKDNPKNYSGRRLLNRFKRLEPSFMWRQASGESRRPRHITNFRPPRAIREALFEEPFNLHKDIAVFYADGTFVNKASRAKLHAEAKSRAETIIVERQWEPHTLEALDYLNSVSFRTFTALSPNLDAAYAAAAGISNLRSRRKQAQILAAIGLQPKPYYIPSRKERTERLFALDLNITSLRSDIRRILTKDWIEADLRNSQLAICAEDWNIPLVKDFLKTDQSIWFYLMECLNIPEEERHSTKKAFKTLLYSILFGMREERLRWKLGKELRDEGLRVNRNAFFEVPIIKVLLEARDIRLRQIVEAGGGVTCFGKELEIGDGTDEKDILAQIAQAKEFSIVAPIFELARQTPDFTVALWQHDGFSIKINRQDRRERTIERIKEFIRERINESGCETDIIIKENHE